MWAVKLYKGKKSSLDYFSSAMEVQTIMSKQGERINNEELKEIIREADLDGDGFINFQGKHAMSNINVS